MILISVQISVHYYAHIIESDVQNCQLSIKVHLECYGRQKLYTPSDSLLLWMFLSIQFFKYPYKKKSRLDKCGDLRHYDTGPLRPIYLPGNVRSKWYLTLLLQCADAPSCWKNICCLVSRSISSSNADNLCCKRKCKLLPLTFSSKKYGLISFRLICHTIQGESSESITSNNSFGWPDIEKSFI